MTRCISPTPCERVSASAASSRARGGFWSSAAMLPQASSSKFALRITGPAPTREQRTTGTPRAHSSANTGFRYSGTVPPPKPACTMARAPAATQASNSSRRMWPCPMTTPTSGNASMAVMSNALAVVCGRVTARYQRGAPCTTAPSAPCGEAKASSRWLCTLATSRALWISSFITTSTPRPADEACAATATACSRLAGPSAAGAVPGRMAPVSTMGLALFTTRCRK